MSSRFWYFRYTISFCDMALTYIPYHIFFLDSFVQISLCARAQHLCRTILDGAACIAVIQFITVEFGQIMTMTFVPLKAEAAGSCFCTAVHKPCFSHQSQRYKWFLVGHSHLDSSHKGLDINRLSEEFIYLDSWH
jgi:hypothetical protein